MPSIVDLKFAGLHTSPNHLQGEGGGLSKATNVIIQRDNIIESRRGFKLYGESFGTSSDRAKQLFTYRERILRHYSNIMQFQNGINNDGTVNFTNFAGTYTETQPGLRIKSIESNGNFYFTTSDGIKKISAVDGAELSGDSGFIINAGGIKALDVQNQLVYTANAQSEFLPGDSAVAYRVLWSYIDNNGNLVRGTPSSRTEIFLPLEYLITKDFLRTLEALDFINQSTSLITDGDYVNTLKLPITATPDQLRTNLIALASKIDNDILYANDTGTGAPLTISSGAIAGTTCTLTFSVGDPTDYFIVGSQVFLAGFVTGTGTINGAQTLTNVTSTTVQFITTATGAVTVTGSSIVSNEYRSLTQPAVPSVPASNDEKVAIQDYLLEIMTQLQAEPNGVIPTALATTYIDILDITTTATVKLNITVPDDVNSSYFYQIYRSDLEQATGTTVLDDLTPNDEMQLVYEAYPTATEITNKEIILTDITPDLFRGAFLYINEATGEGQLQANDLPPFAKDINRFKNTIFYANTKTRQRELLSLIGVTNIPNGTKFMVSDGTTTSTYIFTYGVEEERDFTTDTFANTTDAGYITLYNASNLKSYYFWVDKTGSSVDPAPSGFDVSVKVDASFGVVTASDMADRFRDVINAFPEDFQATSTGATLTVVNTNEGIATNSSVNALGGAWAVTTTTQGDGEDALNNKVLLSQVASPAIAVDETARSLVKVINKNNLDIINAYYLSGSNSVPGQMFFEARDLATGKFYTIVDSTAAGASFSPNISPGTVTITNISVANPTVITTSASHGLTNGNSVVIVGSNSTPSIDGVYPITLLSATTFSIPVNVTVLGTTGRFINASSAEYSDNEEKKNRIYYSKLNEPEAVPIVNYLDVGSQDKAILRIFPLRDSLFIFKEDGLYRLSGEIAPFTLALFDSSVILIAPDSVAVSNNSIFCWTTQGITTISEAGSQIISRLIDNEILKLGSSQYTNFKTATWGVGYESDNSYLVWTIQDTDDTQGTIAYRYSTLTNTWTTFDKINTCGIVNPVDDKLYLGAGDTNYIEQERKQFERYDYADREFETTLSSNSYFGTVLQLSDVSNFDEGDVVVQDQSVSIFEYNMLLKKLDIDVGINDSNYHSTLVMVGGDNFRTSLVDLAQKLDADTGVSSTDYEATIDSYAGTITGISIANPTIITCSANHNLFTGRMIQISGSNSTPSINGNYEVTVLSPTTFSINFEVIGTGTTGTWVTLDSNFNDIRACYNEIITKLNADAGVSFSNYQENTNSTIQESIIDHVDKINNTITVNIALDYIQGPMTIFKAIESTFTTDPQTMGDPLNFKQIRESALLYDNKTFTKATLSFATDLLPEFRDVEFNADGNGIFGHNNFGYGFFGGMGNAAPFRTYVPQQCQRCRYMVLKHTHKVARESYLLLGISLTGEVYSTRAYR